MRGWQRSLRGLLSCGHPLYYSARMNYTFVSATILLILITDPIGNIPIFANVLKHLAPERRTRVMLRGIKTFITQLA